MFVMLLTVSAIAGHHFWQGKTLPLDAVAAKWGKEKLDPQKFKTGPEAERAKMAYSLLKSKSAYVGKHILAIRDQFGAPDGFYFSDVFPAYLIQTANNPGEEAWQIVFLVDTARNVTDVIVHKNCCDN